MRWNTDHHVTGIHLENKIQNDVNFLTFLKKIIVETEF